MRDAHLAECREGKVVACTCIMCISMLAACTLCMVCSAVRAEGYSPLQGADCTAITFGLHTPTTG